METSTETIKDTDAVMAARKYKRAYDERQRAKGYVQISAYIPATEMEALRAYVEKLKRAH